MAIYKPTYCYPHGENIDLHVDPETKAIYLQCQVNTNNKKVTGYRLSLVDANGNVIWEPKDIAPISSLAALDYGDRKSDDHGAGLNGDTLIIPFVQNFKAIGAAPAGSSELTQQCLYTKIDRAVDCFFEYSGTLSDLDTIDAIAEIHDWNINADQDHQITVGSKCLIKRNNSFGIYVMSKTTSASGYALVLQSGTGNTVSVGDNIYVRYGNSNHGKVKKITSSSACTDAIDWIQYIDYAVVAGGELFFESEPLISKLVDGQEYSWQIILYQGDFEEKRDPIDTYIYHNTTQQQVPWTNLAAYYQTGTYARTYSENQYDIMITQGQILGSNGSRLQIYPTDVVLQKYWVQLGKAMRNSAGVVTDWSQYGNRSNIQIYDSIYGHIYPQEGDFPENIIEQNPNDITDCMVYKHSNNPDDVLPSDRVTVATTQNIDATDLIYIIFGGGLPEIDGYAVQSGDLVLVKDLKGYEYLNGVYVASNTGTPWKLSGSYSDWSQYIGKVVLVENGAINSWQNFESTATAGGTISRLTGFGINAVRPYVARSILGYQLGENTITFSSYRFDGTSWVLFRDNLGFNEIVGSYGGNYVFMINIDVGNFPQFGVTRYIAPTRYFIPSDAVNFEQFQIVPYTPGQDIFWVNSISTSTGAGFFSFSDYEAEGAHANTYQWHVNELDNSYYGSALGFRPEQGIVLYPQYENLGGTTPSSYAVDYIYVGEQSTDDAVANITTYNLLSAKAGQDISDLVIDGARGEDIPANSKIAAYSTSGGYVNDWSNLYPIEWVFDSTQMPHATSTGVKPTINVYYVRNGGMPVPGGAIALTDSFKYYLGYDSAGHWSLYSMRYVDEGGFIYYNVNIQDISGGNIAVSTKVKIKNGTDAFYYVVNPGNTVLSTNTTSTTSLGIYTVNSNHTLSTMEVKGSGSSGSVINSTFIFKAAHGIICGGESFIITGTWGNPQAQLGITNRVAKLNINTGAITYIKPATGIEPDQYMVFTEVSTTPQARQIATFDDKEYAVTFRDVQTYPIIYSSVKNDSLKTPYKYKIMSYFKQGDYNPFTFSGEAKVGFLIPTSSTQYSISSDNGMTQQFILDGTTYSVPMKYAISASSSNRGLTLDGFFNQGNGQRWRSYRMAIYSATKDLIQDTGEIYEGDISQTFWGLRVQSSDVGDRTFYCVLIVEDYYNDKYVIGATISVSATGDTFTCTNTVQYNYNLQSVDLVLSGLNNSYFYTIYRQEYFYGDAQYDSREYVLVSRQKPTNNSIRIRDYNITNGRKYVYFLQQEKGSGTTTVSILGSTDTPIVTSGKCWSIAELIPTDIPSGMEGVSTVHQYYAVDSDQVWLFKYNAEFGSQNQNFAKSENQTLGKYPRMGYGLRNNISGQVSALLGSEIKPGTTTQDRATNETQPGGYRERLRSRIIGEKKSSNDSIDLLNAWREIAYSKNPKLLKDVKGQSWIVQITSNQNTPKSQVDGRPDTISFSWVQIDDPKGMVITGDLDANINGDY